MKMLLTGKCCSDNIFSIVDPTLFREDAFELEVLKALTCFYPDYWCGVFSGTFLLEGVRRKADLALIHKKFHHWFVIEVELAGHSLQLHVLPQARCFRYGEPEATCVSSLMTAFQDMPREYAERILYYIPRHVAVISNLPNSEWNIALEGLGVQHLVVSLYQNHKGEIVHEVDGRLLARTDSLGFAQYSAIDKCLRIKNNCGLPTGTIQILDQFDNLGSWTICEENGVLWISKDNGPALLAHECYVQILRTYDGIISFRVSGQHTSHDFRQNRRREKA